jgi:tight adherence protein B
MRLLLAALAGVGVAVVLLPTRTAQRRPAGRSVGARVRVWLTQAGMAGVRVRDVAAAMALVGVAAALVGAALFGGVIAPAVCAALAAGAPLGVARQRRLQRVTAAQSAWPAMLEELRVQTSSLGRSIPQALFEVGRRAPEELRPAFDAAHREWLVTTDFPRTIAVLQDLLADPTADAALETLLVAHEIGGGGLDRRLHALIEDRTADVQERKDAAAKQAGVRFARRFVLLVPMGMAFVGMQIGNARSAYATTSGQLVVVVALAMIAGCWLWAGRIMRLPHEQRVFGSDVRATDEVAITAERAA